jgi:lysophospholipase L1-like esterase
MVKRFIFLAATVLAIAPPALAGKRDPHSFPFKDGDTVVFLGDSITEQRLYTSYLETYLLTRFPNWHLTFRNAGWGGDTSWLRQRRVPFDQALQRDVLALHPDVVLIDFGMNDAGYQSYNQQLFDQHTDGENNLVKSLLKAGVQPIVLTPSAVEKSEPGDALSGYNQSLQQFAGSDVRIAQQNKLPYADQFTPFIDTINRLRSVLPTGRLSGDVVHPGPAGHLMMADFILTGLNAPDKVSSADIDARSGKVKADGAHVTVTKHSRSAVEFTRLDDALVFPIDPPARPVLQYVPVADDIDKYIVRVDNLDPGVYTIAIDNSIVTRASSGSLSEGLNLAFYDSPLSMQGSQILGIVHEKNDAYFNLWRNVELSGSPVDSDQVAKLQNTITDDEAKINALRAPKTYHFTIARVEDPPGQPAVKLNSDTPDK